MNRIDGVNPLATSRMAQGQATQSVDLAGQGPDGGLAPVAGPQDNVRLSQMARTVAEVAAYVAAAPDARAARVTALRQAIANGTYVVDAGEIASRLAAAGSFGDFE